MTLATAAPVTAASVGAISTLAISWRRALRAQNKSPRTIVVYLEGVRLLDQYLAAAGMPREVAHVRREHVEAFIADQLDRWTPSTARSRFSDCQQFFRWALEDGELRESPMMRMTPPALQESPPPVLTDDELRRLLHACEGTGFAERLCGQPTRIL